MLDHSKRKNGKCAYGQLTKEKRKRGMKKPGKKKGDERIKSSRFPITPAEKEQGMCFFFIKRKRRLWYFWVFHKTYG